MNSDNSTADITETLEVSDVTAGEAGAGAGLEVAEVGSKRGTAASIVGYSKKSKYAPGDLAKLYTTEVSVLHPMQTVAKQAQLAEAWEDLSTSCSGDAVAKFVAAHQDDNPKPIAVVVDNQIVRNHSSITTQSTKKGTNEHCSVKISNFNPDTQVCMLDMTLVTGKASASNEPNNRTHYQVVTPQEAFGKQSWHGASASVPAGTVKRKSCVLQKVVFDVSTINKRKTKTRKEIPPSEETPNFSACVQALQDKNEVFALYAMYTLVLLPHDNNEDFYVVGNLQVQKNNIGFTHVCPLRQFTDAQHALHNEALCNVALTALPVINIVNKIFDFFEANRVSTSNVTGHIAKLHQMFTTLEANNDSKQVMFMLTVFDKIVPTIELYPPAEWKHQVNVVRSTLNLIPPTIPVLKLSAQLVQSKNAPALSTQVFYCSSASFFASKDIATVDEMLTFVKQNLTYWQDSATMLKLTMANKIEGLQGVLTTFHNSFKLYLPFTSGKLSDKLTLITVKEQITKIGDEGFNLSQPMTQLLAAAVVFEANDKEYLILPPDRVSKLIFGIENLPSGELFVSQNIPDFFSSFLYTDSSLTSLQLDSLLLALTAPSLTSGNFLSFCAAGTLCMVLCQEGDCLVSLCWSITSQFSRKYELDFPADALAAGEELDVPTTVSANMTYHFTWILSVLLRTVDYLVGRSEVMLWLKIPDYDRCTPWYSLASKFIKASKCDDKLNRANHVRLDFSPVHAIKLLAMLNVRREAGNHEVDDVVIFAKFQTFSKSDWVRNAIEFAQSLLDLKKDRNAAYFDGLVQNLEEDAYNAGDEADFDLDIPAGWTPDDFGLGANASWP